MPRRISPTMVALLLGSGHLLVFGTIFLLGAHGNIGVVLLMDLPIYLLVIAIRGAAGVLRLPLRRLDTLFGPLFFAISGSLLYAAIGYLAMRYLQRVRTR